MINTRYIIHNSGETNTKFFSYYYCVKILSFKDTIVKEKIRLMAITRVSINSKINEKIRLSPHLVYFVLRGSLNIKNCINFGFLNGKTEFEYYIYQDNP